MAKIKAEYLVHYYKQNGLPLFNRMMGLLPTLNALLFKTAPALVPLVNTLLNSALAKTVFEKIGVHPARDLPTYASQTLESWFTGRGQTKIRPGLRRDRSAAEPEKRVILFHDTWANYNETEIGQAAVRVLEAAGYHVQLANGRKCCGRPLLTGGQADKAKPWVDHNVALLAPFANQGIPIVGIEPSCILTLRDEYLNLASDKRRAQILADNAYTFEEFMVAETEAGRFTPSWKTNAGKALLHGHCHHKAMVGNETTVAALKAAGYAVSVIPSGCCGMAGDFGYESDHYEVSRKVGEDRLFPAVRAAEADTTIVASGTSCRHQIGHFTERQPVHLIQALARVIEE
ncbi:MAG: hypothetical protein KDE50_30170 [Caldilineaceae bacterium]|nr:hypothetical protein [Caldilineaceae bacterium]